MVLNGSKKGKLFKRQVEAVWETFYSCSCIPLFSEYKELVYRCLPQHPIPSKSHLSYFPIALYHSPMFLRFVRSSCARSKFRSYFPVVCFSSELIRKHLETFRNHPQSLSIVWVSLLVHIFHFQAIFTYFGLLSPLCVLMTQSTYIYYYMYSDLSS